ncbi:MAG: type II secretion system F family protein [Armatimonadota bacterium]
MSISLKQKCVFFRQLSTLIQGGVPVLRGIAILKNQVKSGKFKSVLSDIELGVSKGESFSSAMTSQGNTFNLFEISIVKAGEDGGALDLKLRDLASQLEAKYNLRLKITGSLLYPILLIHAGIFIPPVIQAVSKGLLFYIKAVLINLLVVYGTGFLLYLLYKLIKSSLVLNKVFDRFILFVPLIGRINYKISVANYLYGFAQLYDAGLSLPKCCEVSLSLCSNTAVKAKLSKIEEYIEKGNTLTESFSRTNTLDPMALGLIASGEETGNTGSALKKAAQFMRKEADSDITKLVIILPVLIIFLIAVYFGYIIIKFYMNYFDNIFKMVE